MTFLTVRDSTRCAEELGVKGQDEPSYLHLIIMLIKAWNKGDVPRTGRVAYDTECEQDRRAVQVRECVRHSLKSLKGARSLPYPPFGWTFRRMVFQRRKHFMLLNRAGSITKVTDKILKPLNEKVFI